MKKWLCALSLCAVTGLGAFGFAGCGDGKDVASISIKSVSNTQFQVGDVITPSLSDGFFTVTYKNGRKSDLPLSVADLVYIDYGNNIATNKFVIEANYQNVIVRYKEKTTSYGVAVSKRNLDLNYSKICKNTYNGEPQSARDALDFVLPNGVYVDKIEYKPHASDTQFTSQEPSEAGQYDLKISLDGGTQYNDKVIEDIVYEIAKADFGDALNKAVEFNDISMQYGDAVQLNKNWTVGENASAYLSTAFKTKFSSIANAVKYTYKAYDENAFKPVPTNSDGAYDLSTIKAGSYILRAEFSGLSNFKDNFYECELIIGTRQLEYGVDYEIDFVQGLQVYSYTPTSDLTDIQTTITTTDPTSITVRVNFKSDVAKNALVGEPQIFFQYSQNNNASWGGSMSKMQEYGYYKINITAKFGDDCVLNSDKAFLSVIIKAPDSGTDGE